MGRGVPENCRGRSGGIVSLAEFVEAHEKAVEHDLLIQTGYTLQDVGRTLSWGALGSFLKQVEPDSAIAEELHPDIAEWSTTFKTNVLLADIYDALSWFCALMVTKGTGKKAHKPEEYPRSWRKKENAFKTVMKGNEWLSLLEGGDKDG